MRKFMIALAALAVIAGAFFMGEYHGTNSMLDKTVPKINRITNKIELDVNGRTMRKCDIKFRDGYSADEWLRGQYTTHGLKQE